MSWWDAPVTQGFGTSGERGVDLSEPYGTPISALQGGQVMTADCGQPWGCELGIATQLPGIGSVIEYFLHLDRLDVGLGQQVQAGQQIGISGGQLSGGNFPNSPGVSSGPHIETGYFRGNFWGPSFDPLAIVRQGPGVVDAGGPPLNPFTTVPILGGLVGSAQVAGGVAGSVAGAAQGVAQGAALAAVTSVEGFLANLLHIGAANAQVFVRNQIVALAVATVVLLVLFR